MSHHKKMVRQIHKVRVHHKNHKGDGTHTVSIQEFFFNSLDSAIAFSRMFEGCLLKIYDELEQLVFCNEYKDTDTYA